MYSFICRVLIFVFLFNCIFPTPVVAEVVAPAVARDRGIVRPEISMTGNALTSDRPAVEQLEAAQNAFNHYRDSIGGTVLELTCETNFPIINATIEGSLSGFQPHDKEHLQEAEKMMQQAKTPEEYNIALLRYHNAVNSIARRVQAGARPYAWGIYHAEQDLQQVRDIRVNEHAQGYSDHFQNVYNQQQARFQIMAPDPNIWRAQQDFGKGNNVIKQWSEGNIAWQDLIEFIDPLDPMQYANVYDTIYAGEILSQLLSNMFATQGTVPDMTDEEFQHWLMQAQQRILYRRSALFASNLSIPYSTEQHARGILSLLLLQIGLLYFQKGWTDPLISDYNPQNVSAKFRKNFCTNQSQRDAAIREINRILTKYTSVQGTRELGQRFVQAPMSAQDQARYDDLIRVANDTIETDLTGKAMSPSDAAVMAYAESDNPVVIAPNPFAWDPNIYKEIMNDYMEQVRQLKSKLASSRGSLEQSIGAGMMSTIEEAVTGNEYTANFAQLSDDALWLLQNAARYALYYAGSMGMIPYDERKALLNEMIQLFEETNDSTTAHVWKNDADSRFNLQRTYAPFQNTILTTWTEEIAQSVPPVEAARMVSQLMEGYATSDNSSSSLKMYSLEKLATLIGIANRWGINANGEDGGARWVLTNESGDVQTFKVACAGSSIDMRRKLMNEVENFYMLLNDPQNYRDFGLDTKQMQAVSQRLVEFHSMFNGTGTYTDAANYEIDEQYKTDEGWATHLYYSTAGQLVYEPARLFGAERTYDADGRVRLKYNVGTNQNKKMNDVVGKVSWLIFEFVLWGKGIGWATRGIRATTWAAKSAVSGSRAFLSSANAGHRVRVAAATAKRTWDFSSKSRALVTGRYASTVEKVTRTGTRTTIKKASQLTRGTSSTAASSTRAAQTVTTATESTSLVTRGTDAVGMLNPGGAGGAVPSELTVIGEATSNFGRRTLASAWNKPITARTWTQWQRSFVDLSTGSRALPRLSLSAADRSALAYEQWVIQSATRAAQKGKLAPWLYNSLYSTESRVALSPWGMGDDIITFAAKEAPAGMVGPAEGTIVGDIITFGGRVINHGTFMPLSTVQDFYVLSKGSFNGYARHLAENAAVRSVGNYAAHLSKFTTTEVLGATAWMLGFRGLDGVADPLFKSWLQRAGEEQVAQAMKEEGLELPEEDAEEVPEDERPASPVEDLLGQSREETSEGSFTGLVWYAIKGLPDMVSAKDRSMMRRAVHAQALQFGWTGYGTTQFVKSMETVVEEMRQKKAQHIQQLPAKYHWRVNEAFDDLLVQLQEAAETYPTLEEKEKLAFQNKVKKILWNLNVESLALDIQLFIDVKRDTQLDLLTQIPGEAAKINAVYNRELPKLQDILRQLGKEDAVLSQIQMGDIPTRIEKEVTEEMVQDLVEQISSLTEHFNRAEQALSQDLSRMYGSLAFVQVDLTYLDDYIEQARWYRDSMEAAYPEEEYQDIIHQAFREPIAQLMTAKQKLTSASTQQARTDLKSHVRYWWFTLQQNMTKMEEEISNLKQVKNVVFSKAEIRQNWVSLGLNIAEYNMLQPYVAKINEQLYAWNRELSAQLDAWEEKARSWTKGEKVPVAHEMIEAAWLEFLSKNPELKKAAELYNYNVNIAQQAALAGIYGTPEGDELLRKFNEDSRHIYATLDTEKKITAAMEQLVSSFLADLEALLAVKTAAVTAGESTPTLTR